MIVYGPVARVPMTPARPLLEVLAEHVAQVKADRELAADVAAGRVCGQHDRPRPCLECA